MEIISCSPSSPEVLRVLQRFSISPSRCCLLAGRALSRKSTGKQARSFIDLPELGCTGGIADGELGAALGQAPCALLGDRAAVHSPGGGLGAVPLPRSPPGCALPDPGATSPDRRCHLNPDHCGICRVPTQLPAWLCPQPIQSQPGHGHSPAGAWAWLALRIV